MRLNHHCVGAFLLTVLTTGCLSQTPGSYTKKETQKSRTTGSGTGSGSSSGSGTGSSRGTTSGSGNGTVEEQSSAATEKKLLLGTRWMVNSVLEDLFGASTSVATGVTVSDILRKSVVDQPASFGGPCDPYANSHPVPVKAANGNTEMKIEAPSVRGCVEPSDSHASISPVSSTSRFAWTIRACEQITSSDAAIRVAATQAGLPSGTSLNSPPTLLLIRSSYDLFFPGRRLPASVEKDLQSVVGEAASAYPNSIESWRFLMLTLCSAPGWQLL